MQDIDIDTQKPVLVTGASGYVAGWVVKRLLDAGATVHATVRDPDNAKKTAHLRALDAETPGTLRLFEADLMDQGSFDEAMAGCGVVFHTASPFIMGVDDPQKQLIEPAQLGTRNVLEAANRTSSVTRVVVTSSCAAIYGDNADLRDTPRGVFDEEVWNTSSSAEHQPYSFSKTLAEREAWKVYEAQDCWKLVVMNPALVLGPGINPHATSESFNILRQMGDGTMRSGAPDIGMGVVDVRDLADAHMAAGFLPDASGRHVLAGHNSSFLEIAKILDARYGDRYPTPRRALPKWLVWLVGPMADASLTRRMISRNVGLPWKADNSKSREQLGVNYRPLEESVTDMFEQLIDSGQLGGASKAA